MSKFEKYFPEVKEYHKITMEMFKVLCGAIRDRKQKFESNIESNRPLNAFDLYIQHNIESEKKQLKDKIISEKDIIGNLIIAQFGASDTAKSLSSSGLSYLSEEKHIDLQNQIFEEIKDNKKQTMLESELLRKVS